MELRSPVARSVEFGRPIAPVIRVLRLIFLRVAVSAAFYLATAREVCYHIWLVMIGSKYI